MKTVGCYRELRPQLGAFLWRSATIHLSHCGQRHDSNVYWHPTGYLRYPIHDVAEKMIKSPRNIKYTKYQKNYTHSRGTPAKRSTSVDFGTYGLQCNEPTMLSLKQLETCRRTLRRVVARRAPI